MSKSFKRLLSLTIALVMVLSMVPASLFQVRAEGGDVYKYTFASTTSLAYSDLKSDVTTFIDEGYNTAYFFKFSGRTEKTSVTTSGVMTRLTGEKDFLAYRLTGLADASAIYTLSVTSVNSHNSEGNVYILPGDTAYDTLTGDYLLKNCTPVGSVGTAANSTHTIESVQISEADISDEDGSVILVFGNQGGTHTKYNFRLNDITLTKTADLLANTYNFVSNDGSTVTLNTQATETPFDNGSWNYVAASSQPTVSIFMGGNMNGSARYAAIRLNGITGAGTATLTFTYSTSQSAPLDFYILPGNTAAADTKPSAEGFPETPDAQLKSYTDAGKVLSQSFTVTIEESDIHENSVILVIRGTDAGQSVNNRLQKLDLTMVIEPNPDQEAADVVIAQIDAIGEVTLESEAAIVAAREAYEALTEEQKALVANLSVLEAAEAALEEEKINDPVANQAAADPVIALINEIDAEITLASEAKIAAAREAYDALTKRQKALVSNAQTLFDAEAALQALIDQEAANTVIEKIEAIGEVTLEDEAAINDARTLYTALTEDQKALVTNLQTLLDAEANLAVLKQQAAVDEVIAKIDAIGEVTLNSAAAISAARTAYNALSAEQKELVTNLQTLIDAEFKLKDLRNPNPNPETFDGIVYDFTTIVDVLNIRDGGLSNLSAQTNLDKLNAAYADGTINYTYYSSLASSAADATIDGAQLWNNYQNYTGYTAIHVNGFAGAWIAMQFKAPASGEYKVQFTFPAKNTTNLSTRVDAFVLPLSDIDASLTANSDATPTSVISALLASGKYGCVASKDVKAATAGNLDAADFWGTTTLEANKEYVIVFRATENKHGGTDPTVTKSNVWLFISGFNLSTPPSADDIAAVEAVMEKIDAIGTVTRGSGDAIKAARAAYEALTAKQKELVENLAVLEKAEARLAELLDPANPIEYIFKNPGHPTTSNGYPSATGLLYGDFTDYAKSGNIFKPYTAYAQPQTSFVKGKWFGMKFTVDKAGDYDVALNLVNSGSDLVTLDVYFVRADELIQGSGNSKNQAFIDGLASNSSYKCYKVDIANAEALSLTGVQLDADEYVIVMINTSGYSVQISETEKQTYNTKCNFHGFAISRTGDYTGPEKVIEQPQPVPNTDKLVYDFYYGGVSDTTKIFNATYLELINNDFAMNKINWTPVADKLNTVISNNYSSVYVNGTTSKHPWTGLNVSSGVGEWLALKIKAPGTGTYDLVLDHGMNVNGTTVAKAYVIPVSVLKDTSAASIEAAIADDTYKLTSTVSFKSSTTKTSTTELGQAQFEVGKDYILVFKATTNKHGTTKALEGENADQLYEAFILLSKLTATKFVPPAPLDQKEVSYKFHRPDMTDSSNVFADGPLGTMANEYVKGVSYWKPYATTVGTVLETYSGKAVYLNGTAKSYKYEAIMVNSLPGEWIGFQIKSPGKGLYTISLTYGLTVNGSTDGEVHVIPLNKLGNGTEEDIQKAIDSGDYKLQRDVNYKAGYADNKYKTSKIGQVNFAYSEEYMVVFRARTNKNGGEAIEQTNKDTGAKSAYQAFMILQEMKLTYATKVETFEDEEEVVPDVTGQSDPEAAAAVDALIDAIGSEITLDSSSAIAAARAAYDLLTANQKKLVTKYQALVDAEAKLAELVSADDKAKAEAVIAKIDAIGTVTLESESAIVAARIAYTLLTNSQRALVSNYSVLLAAEAKLAELKGLNTGSALDQASADAVETLISKIGTVTLESEGAISAARNAYNALTATQKLLVENYDVLVAAEKALAELKAEQQAAQDAEEAAKRKAQQITIMIVAAVVAAAAAGVVTVFAVPSIRTKVLAMFAKNKKKV